MLSLNTPEEIQLWSRVYAAAVACSDIPSHYADTAVEHFRERLPEPGALEKAVEELCNKATKTQRKNKSTAFGGDYIP